MLKNLFIALLAACTLAQAETMLTGGVVVIVNRPGVKSGQLKLSRKVLSDISKNVHGPVDRVFLLCAFLSLSAC